MSTSLVIAHKKDRLGRSAMGDVYQATDDQTVKILSRRARSLLGEAQVLGWNA
jgi:hypothetical protein